MKRLLFVVAMALALLAPALLGHVPAAQAAPTHQTVAHSQSAVSSISGIQVVRASSSAAHHQAGVNPAVPNCTYTYWHEVVGPRQSGPDTVLQANLWVLIDLYSGYYCGQAYTEAPDRLIKNCHTFQGWVDPGQYSNYNIFHCTAALYDFKGPVNYVPCPPGSTMHALTRSDDYPLGVWDTVWGQIYTC